MANSAPAKTKYDGLLGGRKAPAQPEPIEGDGVATATETASAPKPTAATPIAVAKAKAKAKSKDDSYKGYTLLLKIDTHTDANSILKKMRKGEDLSDLTERLLAAWVEENKNKTKAS